MPDICREDWMLWIEQHRWYLSEASEKKAWRMRTALHPRCNMPAKASGTMQEENKKGNRQSLRDDNAVPSEPPPPYVNPTGKREPEHAVKSGRSASQTYANLDNPGSVRAAEGAQAVAGAPLPQWNTQPPRRPNLCGDFAQTRSTAGYGMRPSPAIKLPGQFSPETPQSQDYEHPPHGNEPVFGFAPRTPRPYVSTEPQPPDAPR